MGIVDLIFPKMCIGCRKEGEYICDKCRKQIVRPESICPICCKPSIDGWIHPRCKSRYGMDRLVVGLSYKGLVQKCLKKVKYKSNWNIVECLYKLCEFEVIPEMVVTYVPMWDKKQQERGFNQAEIVADFAVSLPGVSRKVELLERGKETKPMFGLSKIERQDNIVNAFRFVGSSCPERVLIVDDVWTTGATMRECAKILKQNGVKDVWGLTLAR
jgi:ComF family protein